MKRIIITLGLSLLCAPAFAQGLSPNGGSSSGGGGGSGTVTSVSVTTANGVSGSVANPTTTPAITLTLGAISPSTVTIGAGSAITSSGGGGSLGALSFITPAANIATFLTTPSSANFGAALTDKTGTGVNVFATSPTLVTPTLGAASATSINGNAFTTGTYTLTGAAAKTLTFSNSITLAGTDSTTMTFPTSSATVARTDAAQTFTGVQTFGLGSAATPNLVVGNATTGIYSVSTTGIGLTVNGAVKIDYGITNSGSWTTASGVPLFAFYYQTTSNAGAFNIGAQASWTSPGTGNWQSGAADAASPVAQKLSFQSVVAGTTNTAGANATFAGSTSTGSGTAGDFIFQTGGTGAASTAQNAQVTALTIKGATQEVRLPQIASDAGLTDSTVCQDTTNHGLRSGSGTLGICLGTSSERYKTNINPIQVGLGEIMALSAKSFYLDAEHGDPRKLMYGFTAEDCAKVLPKLTGFDSEGRPNTCDYLGIVPVLVRAVQEQQAQIKALRRSR